MGAWGFGSFENDDAADWIAEWVGSGELAELELALERAVQAEEAEEDLEAPEAWVALAAAEVLAALRGQPVEDAPEELTAWVETAALEPDPALLERARRAVRRIERRSELRDLWEASGELETWRASLSSLSRRLG
jgi:hypothetical protein